MVSMPNAIANANANVTLDVQVAFEHRQAKHSHEFLSFGMLLQIF